MHSLSLRLVLLLLMSLPVALAPAWCGPAANRASAPPARGLDSLKTAPQVERFVRGRQEWYHTFALLRFAPATTGQPLLITLPARQENGIGASGKFVRQVPAQTVDFSGARKGLLARTPTSWTTADFDGNGRPDLLVCGYLNGREEVAICFLDLGPAQVQETVLTESRGSGHPFLLEVGRGLGQPIIRRISQTSTWSTAKQGLELSYRVDTVRYLPQFHCFVRHNAHPRDYGIQRMAFKTTKCYGHCPVFTMEIEGNRQARYAPTQYTKRVGTFTATLDAATFQELWGLVNYLNFPTLHDMPDYLKLKGDNWLDWPVHMLTVTYADGQEKTLDPQQAGFVLGQQRVYDLLLAMQESQDWK
jgi:hypothetical protein